MSWLPPYDGGSPIASYQVVFGNDADPQEFSEITAYCDGASYTTLANRYCDVPMAIFRGAPLNLAFKDLIVAKVAATNLIGQGTFSVANTVGLLVQTEPFAPESAPAVTSYDEQSIQLELSPLTGDDAGGSTILYYALEWDSGSGGILWTTYTTMTVDTYFANVSGLSSGLPYRFRYKAQNIHDWGDPSAEVEVTTMTYPSASNVPATEVVGDLVRISWVAPYSGGQGVPIIAY